MFRKTLKNMSLDASYALEINPDPIDQMATSIPYLFQKKIDLNSHGPHNRSFKNQKKGNVATLTCIDIANRRGRFMACKLQGVTVKKTAELIRQQVVR